MELLDDGLTDSVGVCLKLELVSCLKKHVGGSRAVLGVPRERGESAVALTVYFRGLRQEPKTLHWDRLLQ